MLSLCGKFRFSFSLEVYTHGIFKGAHRDRQVPCSQWRTKQRLRNLHKQLSDIDIVLSNTVHLTLTMSGQQSYSHVNAHTPCWQSREWPLVTTPYKVAMPREVTEAIAGAVSACSLSIWGVWWTQEVSSNGATEVHKRMINDGSCSSMLFFRQAVFKYSGGRRW